MAIFTDVVQDLEHTNGKVRPVTLHKDRDSVTYWMAWRPFRKKRKTRLWRKKNTGFFNPLSISLITVVIN